MANICCTLFTLIGISLVVLNIQFASGLLDLPRNFRPGSLRNPRDCARELDDWCRGQDFTMDNGLSSMSFTGTDPGFGFDCTTSRRGGINCRRGRSDWFQCRPDNVLVLHGRPILPYSTRDPEVCNVRNEYFNAVHRQKQDDLNFHKSMGGLSSMLSGLLGK